MTRLDRFLAGSMYGLAVLLTALLAHLVAIFNAPDLIAEMPLTRLSGFVKGEGMTLLPQAAPGAQWAPFADPAVAQGACVFDLAKGPIRVSGDVETDRMVTISFRAPDGHIFYSMTEKAAQRGAVDVLLLTNEQLETLEAESDDEEEPNQELRLISPSRKGFVLVNALAAFPSDRRNAEARVKAIGCKAEEKTAG